VTEDGSPPMLETGMGVHIPVLDVLRKVRSLGDRVQSQQYDASAARRGI
jgi:hypothetical protein